MTKNTGARSRGSAHISRRVTQSVFRAFDFAKAIDRPLNLYVVVNIRETEAACATTVFLRIRRKFRSWLAYKTNNSVAPAYIYAFENPDGMPHVNWAIHVPEYLHAEFQKKLSRWVARAHQGVEQFDVSCEPVNPAYAKKLAKYIVKGTDPAYVEHFYLGDVHTDQGVIWGKRAGISPSLGTTARREAGFRPRRGRYTRYNPPLAANRLHKEPSPGVYA